MPDGQRSGKSQCVFVGMILVFAFGFTFAICGLLLIVSPVGNFILGIIFLVVAVPLVAVGIVLSCKMRSDRQQALQGPIVSGSAPPGAVSRFHVQGNQPGYHQTRSPPYPSAPYPRAPYPSAPYPSAGGLQPSTANSAPRSEPLIPNASQGFDPSAPPPSYEDVVNK